MTHQMASSKYSDQSVHLALVAVRPESVFLQREDGMPLEARIISLTPEKMKSILQEWRSCIKAVSNDQVLSSEMRTRLSVCNKVISNALFDLNANSKNEITAIVLGSEIEWILIGTIKKDVFYVDALATAPKNLCSFRNQPQIRGVGGALFNHAITIANCNHLPYLRLRFFDGAEGFYRKMGMSQTEQGFERKIEQWRPIRIFGYTAPA